MDPVDKIRLILFFPLLVIFLYSCLDTQTVATQSENSTPLWFFNLVTRKIFFLFIYQYWKILILKYLISNFSVFCMTGKLLPSLVILS